MQVWQRVFREAAGPACYNMRGVISASQDGPGCENRVWRQHKWVTRPTDASPGLPAPAEGHRGSGPRRRESANSKPYIVKSACDQTIWDAHARMGPRTGDRPIGRGTWIREPAVGEPRCRGGPDPESSRPPAAAANQGTAACSIGTLRLDWDASARLTPLPAWRHVIRAPAPSWPRSRHCAAAGLPSRRAATV